MNVTCFLEVGTKGNEGVNLKIGMSDLPFIPPIGTMIVAVRGDDYREVESAHWSAHEGLKIFFAFDDLARVKQLKKLGWVSADPNP